MDHVVLAMTAMYYRILGSITPGVYALSSVSIDKGRGKVDKTTVFFTWQFKW